MVGRAGAVLLAGYGGKVAFLALAFSEEEREAMLRAFDAVLTGMAYAGVGLCLFAVVWAGFVLMAEGAEGEGRRGRARNAVVMAVVGLVVVLLAKAIALVISSGIAPILPGP